MQAKRPKVSVLLPVYNGQAYLRQAIVSILHQTYTNFELIIINDGSTDNSEEIIKVFDDSRIVYYKQENQGLAGTLNNGIEASKGEYLARQDQDDYSYPERLEKQVEFLETHPGYGAVGTWAANIDSEVKYRFWKRQHHHKRPPAESFALKYVLLFGSPFVHSSVMIRKCVFDKVGLYSTDKTRQPPEDYELWSRIAREFEIANIPEMLQVYRRGPESMTRLAGKPYIDRATKISTENICYALGRKNPDRSICDLAALVNAGFYKVTQRPCFPEIAQVLYKLAYKMSGGITTQHNIYREMARSCLISIKLIYFKYRYGKVLGWIVSLLSRLREKVR